MTINPCNSHDETVFKSVEDMPVSLTPGQALRKHRQDKNLMQKELAQLTGFTFQFIHNMEVDRKSITLKSAEKLCKALDIPHPVFLLFPDFDPSAYPTFQRK